MGFVVHAFDRDTIELGLRTQGLHVVEEFAKGTAHRLRIVNIQAHAIDIGLVCNIR